jgi:transcriptional regulator with XRE-family HTH domain
MLQRFATMLRYPIPQMVELVYRRYMLIGRKLRELREAKNLSQGDLEERTGLLRCYTSRVENGHTVPAVETLEKYARALEVPLYKLFYDGKGKVKKLDLPAAKKDEALWGAKGKAHRELRLFAGALSRMNDRKRKLLLGMAQKMAGASSK